jgi:hypothetical protein
MAVSLLRFGVLHHLVNHSRSLIDRTVLYETDKKDIKSTKRLKKA